MRRRIFGATITAAALALAACGNGNGNGDGADDDGANGGDNGADDGELTPLTVGVMPIVDTAGIWLGVQEGIFEDHGLDVDLQVAQGGAAIVPSVVSGEYEFGFSNTTSLMLGRTQGLDLILLSGGAASTGEQGNDVGGVVAMPDSGIEGPADLEGASVAVNTLNNIGDVTVRASVQEAGGDPDNIEFVELGFPDMPAAVVEGNVDAAWILEPFLTIAQDDGAELVASNFVDTYPEMLIAGYFTTEAYADENPEIVDAFTAAMHESQQLATEDEEAIREVLGTYTEIDDDVRERAIMPLFPDEVDQDALQALADRGLEFGMLDEEFDASTLLR